MLIRGGRIVTGDGTTLIDQGYVLVRGDTIVEVGPGAGPPHGDDEVVDATSQLICPGFTNGHAHACVPGPFAPVGAVPLPMAEIRANLDRHLLAGETTILNLCGFCLEDEVARVRDHPVRVYAATTHTPACFRTAHLFDGGGLSAAHDACTVERRLSEGAVAIGEVGSGQVLGGGAQDYRHRRAIQADPKKFVALLAAKVVDTVSTDYGGGAWEPVVRGLALAVREKALSVASAIALATGNVAQRLPELADGRGLVTPGKTADLVCTDPEDIGNIQTVIVGGRAVARDGRVLSGRQRQAPV